MWLAIRQTIYMNNDELRSNLKARMVELNAAMNTASVYEYDGLANELRNVARDLDLLAYAR